MFYPKLTSVEHLSKVPVLLGILEGDEIHTPLTTEVPGIEPVPVLKLVPRLSPGEEVVMLPVLLVILAALAQLHLGLVEERPAVRTQPGLVLGEGQEGAVDEEEVITRELHGVDPGTVSHQLGDHQLV